MDIGIEILLGIGCSLIAGLILIYIKKKLLLRKKNYIHNTVSENGVNVTSYIKRISGYIDIKSSLSNKRKTEIIEQLIEVFPSFVQLRKKFLSEVKKNTISYLKNSKEEYLQNCAWWSISSTQSKTGNRFVIGFRNSGCEYWQSEPFYIGCFNCGYCSSVIHDYLPNTHDLELQFDKALGAAINEKIDFDVIEFLNDGSFLNDKEFPEEFRKYLFSKINSLDYISRVLIETRPNYITDKRIKQLLKELSNDKQLEIGIGLETSDDFIRTTCINKGYDKNELKKAIEIISPYKDRVKIVIYTLVKPAFLSETEAINDVIVTAEYLCELQLKYNIDLILKIEPAVVSQGTLLELLYFNRFENIPKYKIISYWSIIEIIATLYKSEIKLPLRIGAREDMDTVLKVPAIYDPEGMFNQYDFIVYESIQLYNTHGSILKLFADIEDAMHNKSFYEWKNTVADTTATELVYSELIDDIQDLKSHKEQKHRKDFLRNLFTALDRIEYGEEGKTFARSIAKRKNWNNVKVRNKQIQKFIENQFRKILSNIYIRIIESNLEIDKPNLLRIFVQIRDLKSRAVHDIWLGIPTKK